MTILYTPALATPEKQQISLGFLPLLDCAPLVIAKEKGFFSEQGLEVSLSREGSWASIRDKVVLGLLDGAQMLAGIPLASSLGLGSPTVPMITAFNIGLNGNAITLSRQLLQQIGALTETPVHSAEGLNLLIQQRKASNAPRLTLASVYPYSAHHYLLRYWLSAAGIDPDKDLNLTVLPPTQMALAMKKGQIDGYCAGEPWNLIAREMGVGAAVISGYEIWNNGPDKVFAVTRRWHDAHPASHHALLCALIQAAAWLDQPRHHEEALDLLLKPEYLGPALSILPRDQLSLRTTCFFRYAASYPWRSHGLWFLHQMRQSGQLNQPVDLKQVACQVYRPDIYREVAQAMRFPHPAIDCKPEGFHSQEWVLQGRGGAVTMGSDLFFNGATFDPNGC